jgi:hypothetical protein
LACLILVILVAFLVYPLSFYWPWLNVVLRASPELWSVYTRCSRITPGQRLEDVTTSMRGLRTLDHLARDGSLSFYVEKHSADLSRVQFSLAHPPRVTRVDFLVD